MKFTTFIALVASASAASTMETMALKDQMKSLQNMVKIAETKEAPAMISAISDRKSELEYQLAMNGKANKSAVARELQYLLSLVKSVESNDHESSTQVLNTRKNKLMKYQMHLADEEEAEEGDEEETEEKADEEAEEGDDEEKADDESEEKADDESEEKDDETEKKDDEETTEEGDDEKDSEDKDAKDEDKDSEDKDTKEEDSEDEAKKGGKVGAIIGGVVVAGLLVGGCVYLKKKRESEAAEGGECEDKKLFKLQFKGNTVKKIQKEALVPTYSIPAEENI
jgi:hypothetical protein